MQVDRELPTCGGKSRAISVRPVQSRTRKNVPDTTDVAMDPRRTRRLETMTQRNRSPIVSYQSHQRPLPSHSRSHLGLRYRDRTCARTARRRPGHRSVRRLPAQRTGGSAGPARRRPAQLHARRRRRRAAVDVVRWRATAWEFGWGGEGMVGRILVGVDGSIGSRSSALGHRGGYGTWGGPRCGHCLGEPVRLREVPLLR